jgi:hypothetical protein
VEYHIPGYFPNKDEGEGVVRRLADISADVKERDVDAKEAVEDIVERDVDEDVEWIA